MSQLEPTRTPAPPQLSSVLGGGWRPEPLAPDQLRRDLDVRDLTDPEAGPHGIQQIVDRAVARLASAWGCDVRWVRGPRTVPIADNYDRLGFDAASVTRDARYTRYVDDAQLLRSHSTA